MSVRRLSMRSPVSTMISGRFSRSAATRAAVSASEPVLWRSETWAIQKPSKAAGMRAPSMRQRLVSRCVFWSWRYQTVSASSARAVSRRISSFFRLFFRISHLRKWYAFVRGAKDGRAGIGAGLFPAQGIRRAGGKSRICTGSQALHFLHRVRAEPEAVLCAVRPD